MQSVFPRRRRPRARNSSGVAKTFKKSIALREVFVLMCLIKKAPFIMWGFFIIWVFPLSVILYVAASSSHNHNGAIAYNLAVHDNYVDV